MQCRAIFFLKGINGGIILDTYIWVVTVGEIFPINGVVTAINGVLHQLYIGGSFGIWIFAKKNQQMTKVGFKLRVGLCCVVL